VKPVLAFVAHAPVASPAPLLPAVARVQPRPSFVETSGSRHRLFALGVLAAHLLLLWGLMQMSSMRRAVAQVAPIVVRLIAPSEPPRPLPPPPLVVPNLSPPTPLLIEAPLIAIAAPPAPSPVMAVQPPPPPAPVVVQAPTPLAVVQPPAPPLIKQIPAGAVRYLREPRMTVPLMSKRLRELGVVHLRVVVDVRGQPREITLARSSGFARLDEQALQDMRSARFVPQTENGQAIEWEVIAPMSYEVER